MEPSIALYNNLILGDQYVNQNVLMQLAPKMELKADLNKYNQLIGILFSIAKDFKLEDLYIGQEHQEIIEAIKNWNIEKPFKLWNIDHHHDASYITLAKNPTFEDIVNEPLSCGNWVVHLKHDNPLFKEYIWVNNKNSDTFMLDPARELLEPYFISADPEIINWHRFDKIFICRSPGWMPPYYDCLTNALTFSLESYIKK